MMPNTLIIGYGNPDRQDDGVAWHILVGTAKRLGFHTPDSPDDGFESFETEPSFLFVLQLTPELAEDIAAYDRVCFVDAHTGAIPRDVNVDIIKPDYHTSPFTHHMTAQTLMELTQTLFHRDLEALIISVRGYEFGFSVGLSARTQNLADEAVQQIINWLKR